MPSVTQVVRQTKQPGNGYIDPRTMTETDLSDSSALALRENISPAAMGLVVDYMSRYAMTDDAEDAFAISLDGALVLDRGRPGRHYDRAIDLMCSIDGVNPHSIEAAYQLVAYDAAFRAGPSAYIDVSDRRPNRQTCQNAITMIQRTIHFAELLGPVVASGMTFQGGYTRKVTAGDADFCTRDTLWDMKVSKYPPSKEHTLQLAMYYLMARHAGAPWVASIESVGVWNPRLDKAWTKRITEIGDDVLATIEEGVIGY